MIKIKTYDLVNVVLLKGIISSYISKFWNEEYKNITFYQEKHLMLMIKVQFSNSEMGYRTLGHLRKVNFNDKDLLINYIVERLGVLNDSYISLPISKIVFSYIIKEGLASENRALLENLSDKELTGHRFNNMQLPISMKPSDYGIIKDVINKEGYIRYYVISPIKKLYQIDIFSNKNIVTLLGASDLMWTDIKISETLFKRIIQKSTLYFMDGEIVLRKQELPSKEFRSFKVEKRIITNFATMDIETIIKDRQHVPYLINIYNGFNHLTSFSLDRGVLFNSFIKNLISLFTERSKKLIVYAHNLSTFDGLFLIKELNNFGEVKPLLFNG